MYVLRNIKARLLNHCYSGEAMSITYSECVFEALGIPACNAHALYCHGWPNRPYSICPHCLIKRHDFLSKVNEIKMCIVIISVTFVWDIFFVLRRIQRDRQKNAYWSSCKLHVILVRFLWKLNFPNRCSKYIQISNLMKICSLGADLFHAVGRPNRQTERQAKKN